MGWEVLNAECREAMAGMDAGSVDAIVTDPPYGLAFMGARWDSFGGSSGRQTVAERRAEGRRYANENKGAPRYANSHAKRVTRDEMVAFQEAMTPTFEEALRVAKPGAHLLCFGGARTFHRMACAIEDAGWNIRDCIMWVYSQGFPHGMNVSKAIDRELGARRDDVPATDEARRWDGWNTQLKPAFEPVIVAQKPLDGTVAHNVMRYGTGAINIDGCRVPTDDNVTNHSRSADAAISKGKYGDSSEQDTHKTAGQELGRFPANLVHDGSDGVLELFPQVAKSQKTRQYKTAKANGGIYGSFGGGREDSPMVGYTDEGSAARFFYCAKASKKDRGEGNDHLTVKPTALMRWLVRLVTPPGGVVLDPFCGSGSTGVACMDEGMSFVGVEMDTHYCEIARGRLAEAEARNAQGSLF